jgi:anti-anti-sigma factor
MLPELRVTADGEATVVALQTEKLDESNIGAIGEQLLGLAGRPRLRLDFFHVEYVDSAALARLVALHRKMHAAGGELTLENVQPFVSEVLEVTGLVGLFAVRKGAGHGS